LFLYCNGKRSGEIKLKKKLFNEAEIIIKNKIDVAYLIPFIEVIEEEIYKIKSSNENKEVENLNDFINSIKYIRDCEI
jgi:hypothetical protein